MGFDKKKIKQIRQLMLLAAILILGLIYSQEVFNAISMLVGIMKPFIYGGVIAFVLNIPLCQIEDYILAGWKGRSADKAKRPVGIILSILFVIVLITIVIATVVPQVAKTAMELGNKIPQFTDKLLRELEQLTVNYPQIQGYVDELGESSAKRLGIPAKRDVQRTIFYCISGRKYYQRYFKCCDWFYICHIHSWTEGNAGKPVQESHTCLLSSKDK